MPARQRVGSSGVDEFDVGQAAEQLVERDHRACGPPGRRVTTSSWTVVWRYSSSSRGAPPRARSSAADLGRDRAGRSEHRVDDERPLQPAVELVVGREADAGEHLLGVRGRGACRLAGERLGDGGEQRVDVVGAGVRPPSRHPRSPRATRPACGAPPGTTRPIGRTARGRSRASGRRRASTATPPISWWASATRAAATARRPTPRLGSFRTRPRREPSGVGGQVDHDVGGRAAPGSRPATGRSSQHARRRR